MAEKVLVDLTKAAPEDPEAYMTLARYYQASRKPKEAIEAYNAVLEHPQGGGGIAAHLNIRREVESLYNISWMYMDMVEDARRRDADDEAKEALAKATDYSTKLRAAQSTKAYQDLLEGRLLLLNDNIRDAITSLQRADAVFGKNTGSPQWLQSKAVLAQAFEKNTESGDALALPGRDAGGVSEVAVGALQKARVLCRVARAEGGVGAGGSVRGTCGGIANSAGAAERGAGHPGGCVPRDEHAGEGRAGGAEDRDAAGDRGGDPVAAGGQRFERGVVGADKAWRLRRTTSVCW